MRQCLQLLVADSSLSFTGSLSAEQQQMKQCDSDDACELVSGDALLACL